MAGHPAISPRADAGLLALSDPDFQELSTFLHARFGLIIEPGKRDILASKLARVLRELGVTSWRRLHDDRLERGDPHALTCLINHMTTNHTFFWREPAHFEYLRSVALPDLAKRLRTSRDLRVWCAAASTGEEPYTLAILLRTFFGPEYPSWKAGVLATDISARALGTASAGEYDATSLGAMPPELVARGFQIHQGRALVHPDVKGDVLFRRFNLMTRPLPFQQPLHVIFCRNVMIYFDAATNADLSRAMYEALAPGGYLFVGHSEPLDRRWTPFTSVGPAIYRRPL
jgi:chemotaxis protein methyltransferase CheR